MTRYAKAPWPSLGPSLVIGLAAAVFTATALAAPSVVRLRVETDGSVDLGDSHFIDEGDLQTALKILAHQQPRPEVHIVTDPSVSSEKVGRVILLMQKAGLANRVGSLTAPPK